MTLYDLYLDNDVEGYIVFKTLSRKRIMEIINHYYDEKLIITSESFQKRGECLTLSIDRYFYDYLELYFQIVKNKKETTIHNDLFHLSMTSPLEQMVHNQVPTILFGTTKLFQSFIMISNTALHFFPLHLIKIPLQLAVEVNRKGISYPQ